MRKRARRRELSRYVGEYWEDGSTCMAGAGFNIHWALEFGRHLRFSYLGISTALPHDTSYEFNINGRNGSFNGATMVSRHYSTCINGNGTALDRKDCIGGAFNIESLV